jgi:hypothetical protein
MLGAYDNDQTGFIAGGAAISTFGTRLGVHVETRQVSYRQDFSVLSGRNTYSLYYTRLDTVWPISGRTRLSGRVGQARLDPSGVGSSSHAIGNLDLLWSLSAKTVFDLGYMRDYDPPGRSLLPTLYQKRYLKLTSQLSGKTLLQAELLHERRNYTDSVLGRETTTSLRLSLVWHPTLALNLSPYISRVKRDSQSISDEYRDNQIGATINANF